MMQSANTAKGWTAVLCALVVVALCLAPVAASAAEWSTTELQYEGGQLDNPGFAGGGDTWNNIFTLQHASGWKYGDNFFFIDWLDGGGRLDAYGEWYSNFSLGKITGNEISAGPIRDVGVIGGVNYGADPNVRIYLPGGRLSWDLPGFAFANTDITAYIVENHGLSEDDPLSAPDEDNDGWMVDFNFSTKQLELVALKWNIEGHVEYIKLGDNEFNSNSDYWILGQPQVRADVSKLVGLPESTLFAGIEYQFWINKLGDDDTDESTVQALVVWRL